MSDMTALHAAPDSIIEVILARNLEANEVAEKYGGAKRPLTDLGLSERLIDSFHDDILYDHEGKRWLLWDGKRFAPDVTAKIEHLAGLVVRSIYGEAARTEDKAERKAIAEFARRSENVQRLKAMVTLGRANQRIAIKHEELDSDGFLYNCDNGTLDLRSATLRPYSKADRITKLAPVAYDAHADCPRWLKFIDEVTLGRVDLHFFLQRFLGYCLTSDLSEQCFALCYGTGMNGKSVLLNVVARLMGDYCADLPINELMVKKYEGSTNAIRQLKDYRLVTAKEGDAGKKLAEGLVKQLSGKDAVTARALYHEHETFRNVPKLILCSNHKPKISGTDAAIWRRVRLLPFEYYVPPAQVVKNLDDRLLEEEAPGIFRWMVEGCTAWQQEGLPDSEVVSKATANYRAEEDTMADFLQSRCERGAELSTTTGSLYEAYKRWGESSGERLMSLRRFSSTLQERGEFRRDDSGRHAMFYGLRVRDEYSTDPDSRKLLAN